MRLTLTAEHRRLDMPVTRLCLSDDASRVHALERIDGGWRLHDRDAVTLAALPDASFELLTDGPLQSLGCSADGAVFEAMIGLGRDSALHVIDRARGVAFAVRFEEDSLSARVSPDGRVVACWSQYAQWVVDVARGTVTLLEDPDRWLDWNGLRRIATGDDRTVSLRDVVTGETLGIWREPEGWEADLGVLTANGGFWIVCARKQEGLTQRRDARISRHGPDASELAHVDAMFERTVVDAWVSGERLMVFGEWGLQGMARCDATAGVVCVDAPAGVTRPPTLGALSLSDCSPDGTRFTGKSGVVPFLVDTARDRAVSMVDGVASMVTSLAQSADGRRVGATLRGGTALVLDAATLEVEWTFEEGHDWMEACAFDPGGRVLYTLSERALRAWSLDTGMEFDAAPLDGLDNEVRENTLQVWTLSVSSDGATAWAFGRDDRDADDLLVTFDLTTFRVVAMGRPERLPRAVGPLPADPPAFAMASGVRALDDLRVIELDATFAGVAAEYAWADARWETDARPTTNAYDTCVLPDGCHVAVVETRVPVASGQRHPTCLIRWDLRAGSRLALDTAPGLTWCVERAVLVRLEFSPACALVLRDAQDLRELARIPYDERRQWPTAVVVTRDRSAVFIGTRRGAVLRYALDDATSPTA